MKLTLLTQLTLEQCRGKFADPAAFQGTRFSGDTRSGGGLDVVNPYEIRFKWRWGPFYPFIFTAQLTRGKDLTKIEGRLLDHPMLEALSLLIVFPEWGILIGITFAALLVLVVRCCISISTVLILATAATIATAAITVTARVLLLRKAQADVHHFLDDVVDAFPEMNEQA